MKRWLTQHGPWLALLVAYWPVWGWYARRTVDGVDEPWGLLALVTVAFFTLRSPRATRHEGWGLAVAALLTATYAAFYAVMPPLARALFAATSFAFVLSTQRMGRRLHVPVAGLLLLSLPVMSSLLFYAGYPLRRLVTLASVPLLGLGGYAVEARGVTLAWGERLVAVDAPCSGVKMLWAAAFLTFTLALLFQLNARRTILLSVFAFVVVIAGNILRATALFFLEADVIEGPAFLHTGIGLVVFLGVGTSILLLAMRKEEPWQSAPSS